MDYVDEANSFFTILTLLANAALLSLVLVGLATLAGGRARAAAARAVGFVGPQARALAWLVALVATAGSLYYSEVASFTPCVLCWYQRICMYPLVVVLGIGWARRDPWLKWYATAFVAVGAPLSLYHWLVERVPALSDSVSCSLEAPCSVPWFQELGYVTLAFMALSAFALIGALVWVDTAYRRSEERDGTVVADKEMQ